MILERLSDVREGTDDLYERDFHEWSRDRAKRLHALAGDELDWGNIASAIGTIARSERGELRERLHVLLCALLVWQHQPEKRAHSLQGTIGEQRTFIEGILDMSPSLRPYAEQWLPRIWSAARRDVAARTGLPSNTFPIEPEFTIEQVLNDEFMPGPPWSPGDLIRD